MIDVGKRLKSIREELGLNQSKMANRLGDMSVYTYRKYEQNQRTPSISSLEEMLNMIGISFEEFVKEEVEKEEEIVIEEVVIEEVEKEEEIVIEEVVKEEVIKEEEYTIENKVGGSVFDRARKSRIMTEADFCLMFEELMSIQKVKKEISCVVKTKMGKYEIEVYDESGFRMTIEGVFGKEQAGLAGFIGFIEGNLRKGDVKNE